MKKALIPAVVLGLCMIFPLAAQDGESFLDSIDCGSYLKEGPSDPGKRAQALNTAGYRAYKEYDIEKAARLFYCAVRADDRHVKAHYNLACMLALLRVDLSVCEWDHLDDIFTHLKKALQIEPERREKMKEDEDLQGVRDYPFFRMLLLRPEKGAKDILVQAGDWYGPKPGVYPASPVMRFYSDGFMLVKRFTMAGEGDPGYEELEREYVIEDGRIVIQGYSEETPVLKGDLHYEESNGVIIRIHIKFDNGLQLSLDPDDCSA